MDALESDGDLVDTEQQMETDRTEGDPNVGDEPVQEGKEGFEEEEEGFEEESDDQGEDDDEEEEGQDQNSDYKRQVFVGGLLHTTTEADLKNYFSAYGTVVETLLATNDKLPTTKGKSVRSKGFGFVTMSTQQEANDIVQVSHTLHGRLIVVEPSRAKDAVELKLRISVTGLNKGKTSKESLREYFGQFGEVSECILSMAKVDDKLMSRGYAVIKMGTEEAMNAALAANSKKGRQTIDGTSVEVKKDKNKIQRYQLNIANIDPDKTTTADIRECFSMYGTILELFFSLKVTEEDSVRSTHAFLRMSTDEQHEDILRAQLSDTHVINDRVLEITKDHEKLRRFYIDDIDKERTIEADLEGYFGKFGVVQECSVFREKPSEDNEGEGVSKGYAMILMSTVEEADAILKHKETHVIHDKELSLGRTVAVPPIKEHPTKMTVTCLKGTNLKEKDLRDYFTSQCTIKTMQFPISGSAGEHIGFALMELDSHHDVEKFAMMRDHFIKNNRVIVNKVKKKKAANLQHLINKGRGQGRGGHSGYGNTDWDYGPPRWGDRPPPWAVRPSYRGGGPQQWGGGPPPWGRGPPPWARGRGFRGRGWGPHDGWGDQGHNGPRFRGRGGGPGAGGWGGSGNEWNNRLSSPKMIRRGWGRHRGRPY